MEQTDHIATYNKNLSNDNDESYRRRIESLNEEIKALNEKNTNLNRKLAKVIMHYFFIIACN